MDTSYADACIKLQDLVARACSQVSGTLCDAEIATELRRIADTLEAG